jgi:hypothetical protein
VTGNGRPDHTPDAGLTAHGNGAALAPGENGATPSGEPRAANAAGPDPGSNGHAPVPTSRVAVAPARRQVEQVPAPTPRASHEDVMRRARELRQRQQHDGDEQEPRT